MKWRDAKFPAFCKRCQKSSIPDIVLQNPGPNYARANCGLCGEYLEWVEKPDGGLPCGHAILYQQYGVGPYKCLLCNPPPRQPDFIGLLQADGSVLSAEDLLELQRRRNTEGAEKSVAAILAEQWPDGDWKFIHPRCGAEGWPLDTFGSRE